MKTILVERGQCSLISNYMCGRTTLLLLIEDIHEKRRIKIELEPKNKDSSIPNNSLFKPVA